MKTALLGLKQFSIFSCNNVMIAVHYMFLLKANADVLFFHSRTSMKKAKMTSNPAEQDTQSGVGDDPAYDFLNLVQ